MILAESIENLLGESVKFYRLPAVLIGIIKQGDGQPMPNPRSGEAGEAGEAEEAGGAEGAGEAEVDEIRDVFNKPCFLL